MPEIFRQQHADESITLFLVEDDPGGVRLTQEAFETTGRQPAHQVVTTGDDALAFSRQQGEDDQASHC